MANGRVLGSEGLALHRIQEYRTIPVADSKLEYGICNYTIFSNEKAGCQNWKMFAFCSQNKRFSYSGIPLAGLPVMCYAGK